ncbi:MAG TPA: hypothetical protein DCY13_09645, partial [Verrucomicrobiales bacterium]|nr:hypothetical protein [Verrucomicrobiales bacterium]
MTPAPDAAEEAVLDLVSRAKGGDVEAFAGLVRQFEVRVFHFILRMVRRSHDAEDLTQETFVKVWKNLHRFRAQNAFATWLFTIARRSTLNHLRGLRPVQELADYDEAIHDDPAHAAMDQERAAAVWQLARRLKPDQYEALWLRYGEGFSVDETA